ncbi:hypothetical protein [Helicobacter sp. UBA3407]|uniref:hypothetical protein n=1 Tax=Helicobacter TaxID=209 RepID=UPI00261B8511|nr:hypothetical protein [Helicobacter sp. UBA3407]
MEKVRIKDKGHLESLFKQYAENEGMTFYPNMIVEGNSGLEFQDLVETCEVIGYENLLFESDFAENPKGHCDTFYIDLIGIKGFRFGLGIESISFFGGKIPDELHFENDGTLRVWFD